MAFNAKHFEPANVKGIGAIPYVKRQEPSVFACLARNKNGNLVVMQADAKGIHFFWLDLEPSYKSTERKNDRDEFSTLDHMAYGYTYEKRDYGYSMRMNKMPHHEIQVRLLDGKSIAYVYDKGIEIRLDFIYVNAGYFSYEIDVYGMNEKTNERVCIRAT